MLAFEDVAPGGTAKRPSRARQDGLGLIDTLVSAVVIAVSILGFLSATLTSTSLEKQNRTIATANELSRSVVEQMLALPIAQVLPSYNANPADDPNGAGTAPGEQFVLQTAAQTATSATRLVTNLVTSLPGTGSPAHDDDDDDDDGGHARSSVSAANGIPRTMTCRIELPTTVDATGADFLREDVVAPEFGLPADLNGDGVIDAANHAADYQMLPVIIRLEWSTSGGGTRSATYAIVLGQGFRP